MNHTLPVVFFGAMTATAFTFGVMLALMDPSIYSPVRSHQG